jgi:hypothetical protein
VTSVLTHFCVLTIVLTLWPKSVFIMSIVLSFRVRVSCIFCQFFEFFDFCLACSLLFSNYRILEGASSNGAK